MSFTETLEQALVKDFIVKLRDQIKLEEQLITGQVLPHDEYAEHVGKLNGLRFAEELFLQVVKAYFPTN